MLLYTDMMPGEFSQRDLPALSGKYYDFADILAREHLDRRFFVADIYKRKEDDRIVLSEPRKGEKKLVGLSLLSRLRDLESYQGSTREITIANSINVARVDGLATRQIYDVVKRQEIQFSDTALGGLHRTLSTIHDRLYRTYAPYAPLSNRSQMDEEALYRLTSAGRILVSWEQTTPSWLRSSRRARGR